MIEKTIHRLLKHRHFWRDVGFDELGEIYTSMVFRSLAINLTGIFIPVYMLGLHYDVVQIMSVFFWCFFFRATVFDVLAGYLTVRFGPKHTILLSYAVLIVSTLQFLTLSSISWPLWLLGGLWGATSSLYYIPFHVDFSKIKHRSHGGKELGYANIMEKSGAVMGPIIGGIIATVFGGQYIFLVAMGILMVGGLPLLRTAEPLAVHQRLKLTSMPLRAMRRDIVSFISFGTESTICVLLWPLFLAVYVLTHGGAYAKLGMLASVSVIASMATAYTIGKLVDGHRGRVLLRSGAIINALLHLFRAFVTTYPMALLVNTANEAVTVAYRLPYTKGMYDVVDDTPPGFRASYFTIMEMAGSAMRAFLWLLLILGLQIVTQKAVFNVGFAIAALASLLIMLERFPALAPPQSHVRTVIEPTVK